MSEIQLNETAEFQDLSQKYTAAVENSQLMLERLAELEFALEDQSWQRLLADSDREFSPNGRATIRRMARLAFLKSPLINHAVRIQANYVWAQGMNTNADNEDVNTLLQDFLDDKHNRRVLTGSNASKQTEMELQVEGDLFIGLTWNQATGHVRVKKFVPDQITDVYTNPEDESEIWFYKRQFRVRGDTVRTAYEERTVWYPDYRYIYNENHQRPSMIDDQPVDWDIVIKHTKVGGFSDSKFGVPEIYNALDWAIAVKSNLEDFASITRALTRFAWRARTKGGPKNVAGIKTKLSTTLGSGNGETNPVPVAGSTLISTDGVDMDPIKTAGIAPSPDESQRLWLMVSAGTGIPLTMLAGDAEAGSYATAQTLDRPTELQMRARQSLWADLYKDIYDFVIDRAIEAPSGPLKGDQDIDEYTGEIEWVISGDTDGTERQFDIEFPSILKRSMTETVSAVVAATTLDGKSLAGTIDRKTTIKLLLSALELDDTDELIEQILEENPEYAEPEAINPATPPMSSPVMAAGSATGQQPPSGNVAPIAAKTPNALQAPKPQQKTEALRESAAIPKMADSTAKAIADGAKRLRDGKMSKDQFVAGARTVLHSAYRDAAHNGGKQAHPKFTPDNSLDQAMVGRAEAQVPFLGQWADRLMGTQQTEAAKPVPAPPIDTEDDGMSDDAIDNRAGMYGNTVRAAFFAGMVMAAGSLAKGSGSKGQTAQAAEPTFQWEGGDCALCSARDGETYSESDLPGLPGEGDFGELCEGGPNCNCNLTILNPVSEAGRLKSAWSKFVGGA